MYNPGWGSNSASSSSNPNPGSGSGGNGNNPNNNGQDSSGNLPPRKKRSRNRTYSEVMYDWEDKLSRVRYKQTPEAQEQYQIWKKEKEEWEQKYWDRKRREEEAEMQYQNEITERREAIYAEIQRSTIRRDNDEKKAKEKNIWTNQEE